MSRERNGLHQKGRPAACAHDITGGFPKVNWCSRSKWRQEAAASNAAWKPADDQLEETDAKLRKSCAPINLWQQTASTSSAMSQL